MINLCIPLTQKCDCLNQSAGLFSLQIKPIEMKKIVPLCLMVSLFFLLSCDTNNSNVKETKTIAVDSLNMLWNQAWNQKDSSKIVEQIAKDALLISNRLQVKGVDSISTKFVHHYLGAIADLQSHILETKTWPEGCYLSGTYTFNVLQSGKIVGKEEGVYTFIWEKQFDQTLKLKILHMEEYK